MERARTGLTLIELAATLLLLGILAALALPPLASARNTIAATAARDAFAAIVARARIEALHAGGASVVLHQGSGRALIETARGPVGDSVAIAHTFGVGVSADGAAPGSAVTVSFDAFGVGRVASRTFRFRRGAAEARLSLSSYGRSRRW